jgi:hypothetical protein
MKLGLLGEIHLSRKRVYQECGWFPSALSAGRTAVPVMIWPVNRDLCVFPFGWDVLVLGIAHCQDSVPQLLRRSRL